MKHPPKEHNCVFCQFKSSTKKELEMDEDEYHNEQWKFVNETNYACNKCDFKTKNEMIIKMH